MQKAQIDKEIPIPRRGMSRRLLAQLGMLNQIRSMKARGAWYKPARRKVPDSVQRWIVERAEAKRARRQARNLANAGGMQLLS